MHKPEARSHGAQPRRPAVAERASRVVHELSTPGGRPLCGADAVLAPPHQPLRVTCTACLRLLADDARRAAHAGSPRADESED
ncbi:conserved hypothetical protein [Anaeromyxobacter dehalogenans 2CP-1]|uniref:Uncharacterized protein n=1 Tax=Anaeromyxobacter dehalogenans (strain ATCC BAA-258 / DSM 21875 / 2CP-1) TaxID=455488 RepID=B8J9B7_ANAD2|nr:hypothetical protein [Anaeromyxobacter dehalogenans]ACL65523.1 conserved hypothetical protein [Anaeromyxobacter dehalogenans 2CP-1]